MRYRKLRIAWSVVWGVVAVLLCMLWVRSYWRQDEISINYLTDIGSNNGTVYLHWSTFPIYPGDLGSRWIYSRNATDADKVFMWQWDLDGGSFALLYWLPIMLSAAITVGPWMRWSKRFSLRTLLIVTTLLAAALGLITSFGR